jgi:hypothetical protein
VTTTRRDLLSTALTAAGVTVTPKLIHASDHHEHDHQDVPSDPALRVKALETLLVESGPIRVLRGEANRFGSGPKFRMPAFEVIA